MSTPDDMSHFRNIISQLESEIKAVRDERDEFRREVARQRAKVVALTNDLASSQSRVDDLVSKLSDIRGKGLEASLLKPLESAPKPGVGEMRAPSPPRPTNTVSEPLAKRKALDQPNDAPPNKLRAMERSSRNEPVKVKEEEQPAESLLGRPLVVTRTQPVSSLPPRPIGQPTAPYLPSAPMSSRPSSSASSLPTRSAQLSRLLRASLVPQADSLTLAQPELNQTKPRWCVQSPNANKAHQLKARAVVNPGVTAAYASQNTISSILGFRGQQYVQFLANDRTPYSSVVIFPARYLTSGFGGASGQSHTGRIYDLTYFTHVDQLAIFHSGDSGSCWQYKGDYMVTHAGSLSSQEFSKLDRKIQQACVSELQTRHDKSCATFRARILLRERGVALTPEAVEHTAREASVPTQGAVMDAFLKGDESVYVTSVRRVAYDNELARRLNEAVREERTRFERKNQGPGPVNIFPPGRYPSDRERRYPNH